MNGRGRLSYFVEVMLYVTAGALVAGHVINRVSSPRPLDPLWNRISTFAASRYGGNYVTAGIGLFALCLLLFGILTWASVEQGKLAKLGGVLIAMGSLPMLLVGVYPIYTPHEGNFGGALIVHTTEEMRSNHLHYVASGVAFGLLLAGILLVSLSLLEGRRLKVLGWAGLILLPVTVELLGMTYRAHYYNGTWQRCAFLLPFAWMLTAARAMRGVR